MKNCPKLFLSISAIFISFLVFATMTNAAAPDGLGPWADTVVSAAQGLTKGGGAVPPTRSDPTSALGVAENNTTEGNFYSLGFGGVLTLGFVNGISSGVIVIEATNPGYPDEHAKIEVSANGTTWFLAGNVTADGNVNVPQGVGCVKYVRITDTSNPADFSEATADAYDVDGVQGQGELCTSPTPTPAPSQTPGPSSTPNPGGGTCGCGNTSVTQSNSTSVTNVIGSNANSGNNKSNFNTGGSSVVVSGSSSSTVGVFVQGGSNNAVISKDCCCTGGTTNISGNGAGSVNTVNLNSFNNIPNNQSALNALNLKKLKKP